MSWPYDTGIYSSRSYVVDIIAMDPGVHCNAHYNARRTSYVVRQKTIQYTVYCMLHGVHFTFNVGCIRCTMYTDNAYSTMYIVQCTLRIIHFTLYTVHCSVWFCTIHAISYAIYFSVCIIHLIYYTYFKQYNNVYMQLRWSALIMQHTVFHCTTFMGCVQYPY